MADVREVITAAIPCNIVYGRYQAADKIIDALTAAGFRIVGPGEVDKETVEKCAEVVRGMVPNIPHDGPSTAMQEVEYMALGHALAAIRALAEEKRP